MNTRIAAKSATAPPPARNMAGGVISDRYRRSGRSAREEAVRNGDVPGSGADGRHRRGARARVVVGGDDQVLDGPGVVLDRRHGRGILAGQLDHDQVGRGGRRGAGRRRRRGTRRRYRGAVRLTDGEDEHILVCPGSGPAPVDQDVDPVAGLDEAARAHAGAAAGGGAVGERKGDIAGREHGGQPGDRRRGGGRGGRNLRAQDRQPGDDRGGGVLLGRGEGGDGWVISPAGGREQAQGVRRDGLCFEVAGGQQGAHGDGGGGHHHGRCREGGSGPGGRGPRRGRRRLVGVLDGEVKPPGRDQSGDNGDEDAAASLGTYSHCFLPVTPRWAPVRTPSHAGDPMGFWRSFWSPSADRGGPSRRTNERVIEL